MITVHHRPRSQSGLELARRLRNTNISGEVWWGLRGSGLGGHSKLNGPQQLSRLREAGVVVPDWSLTRPSTTVSWAGRQLRHTQGRDIRFATQRGWTSAEFWVQWLESSAEWRIHIFGGRSIARGLKHFASPGTPPPNPIRSRRLGWRMQHDIDPPRAVREAARAAVAALHYDFGAVDCLVTPSGPVVLEVNSAPGLDNYTATAYARAITQHFSRS